MGTKLLPDFALEFVGVKCLAAEVLFRCSPGGFSRTSEFGDGLFC